MAATQGPSAFSSAANSGRMYAGGAGPVAENTGLASAEVDATGGMVPPGMWLWLWLKRWLKQLLAQRLRTCRISATARSLQPASLGRCSHGGSGGSTGWAPLHVRVCMVAAPLNCQACKHHDNSCMQVKRGCGCTKPQHGVHVHVYICCLSHTHGAVQTELQK